MSGSGFLSSRSQDHTTEHYHQKDRDQPYIWEYFVHYVDRYELSTWEICLLCNLYLYNICLILSTATYSYFSDIFQQHIRIHWSDLQSFHSLIWSYIPHCSASFYDDIFQHLNQNKKQSTYVSVLTLTWSSFLTKSIKSCDNKWHDPLISMFSSASVVLEPKFKLAFGLKVGGRSRRRTCGFEKVFFTLFSSISFYKEGIYHMR